MSSEIHVTARFRAQADKIADIIDILTELAARTREEGGCLDYGYYQSKDDPTLFTSIETWSDATSESAHWETQHLKDALAQLPAVIDGVAEITKYDKVA